MPAGAHLQQQRLARRVGEELRDRGGEDVGRLVAVVPRRDAERLPAARRRAHDVEGDPRPRADVRAERRHRRPAASSASSRPSGQERAEVGRLHGARTATRGHGEVVAERVAEARRGGVRRAAALERVTAHDADQVASGHPRRQGRVDVVVVQRHRQGVLRTGAGPRPGVASARRGCRGSAGRRRGRRGSRAWTGRCRPGCRGSRAARSHRHGVRRRRRRRRSRSRGTAPRRATARAAPARAR